MLTTKFPVVRKECSFRLRAAHDLYGVTAHADADAGVHMHEWTVTCIFVHEINCRLGFGRDEVAIADGWGSRIAELEGRNLSELMQLPATAENFALWLLLYWLRRLSPHEINYELTGVRVTKGDYSSEVMYSAANKRGWQAAGGECA